MKDVLDTPAGLAGLLQHMQDVNHVERIGPPKPRRGSVVVAIIGWCGVVAIVATSLWACSL